MVGIAQRSRELGCLAEDALLLVRLGLESGEPLEDPRSAAGSTAESASTRVYSSMAPAASSSSSW